MDRSFVRLEAGSSTAEALTEIDGGRPEWLVVRHPSPRGPEWFAVDGATGVSTLEDGDAEATVFAALHLHSAAATATVHIDDLVGVEHADETLIVVAGPNRVVGLLPAGAAVPAAISAPDRGAVRGDSIVRRSAPATTAATPAGPGASMPMPTPGGIAAGAPASAVFNADTHVAAPTQIAAGTEFDLTISLSNPGAIAGDGRLTVMLDAGVTEFDLDVQLFAEGFTSPQSLHGKLHVDANRLDASTITFPLTAVAPPAEVQRLIDAGEAAAWEASITAFFLYRGNPAGWRVHRMIVQADPNATIDLSGSSDTIDLRDDADTTEESGVGTGLTLTDLPVPDLTIVISDSDPSDGIAGRFTVTLTSPHPTVPPDTAYDLNIGRTAASWAAQATKAIKKSEGPMAYEGMRGQGHRIARLVHHAFWDQVNATLRHVRTEEDRTPTVLLCTSDPHVPWELAYLGDTPVHDDAPPFLAAQARVGRWILDPPNDVPMAPSAEITVDNVAAVVGEYAETPRWDRLPQAEAEGTFLADQFGATYRSADGKTIEGLFKRSLRNPPQLMHFACHGTSGQQGNALLSNDGTEFYDFMFEASAAGREDRPFVFLNACRVGAADEALTQYGGFAATFLRSGFTGFIGPLWDVDDTIAHEIATSFYKRAADGESPSEILRSVRANFVEHEGQDDPPTTYMAYVYYGHPAATITGLRRKGLR